MTKAIIRIDAKFSAEFEGEYSDEVREKLNKKAEKVRDAIAKILGFDPKTEVHFEVTIDHKHLASLDDFLAR